MSDTLTKLRAQNAELRDALAAATKQLAEANAALSKMEKDKQDWKSMAHSLLLKLELDKIEKENSRARV